MSHVDVIKAKVAPLALRIDSLSLRERLLVLATAVILFAGLWHTILMQPLAQRADETRAELSALEDRISVANRSLEDQILQLAGNGDEQRSRIALLRKRIDEINVTLGDHAAELIDPSEMARVLEGVLQEQAKLTLVSIRNAKPEFLTSGDDVSEVTFYRHGFEIEVEGSYVACVQYLNAIESLPWRLYWQVLELDVIDYPQNRVRIEVSTLSLDEEWIGA